MSSCDVAALLANIGIYGSLLPMELRARGQLPFPGEIRLC